jgi:hypothetical protein
MRSVLPVSNALRISNCDSSLPWGFHPTVHTHKQRHGEVKELAQFPQQAGAQSEPASQLLAVAQDTSVPPGHLTAPDRSKCDSPPRLPPP